MPSNDLIITPLSVLYLPIRQPFRSWEVHLLQVFRTQTVNLKQDYELRDSSLLPKISSFLSKTLTQQQVQLPISTDKENR